MLFSSQWASMFPVSETLTNSNLLFPPHPRIYSCLSNSKLCDTIHFFQFLAFAPLMVFIIGTHTIVHSITVVFGTDLVVNCIAKVCSGFFTRETESYFRKSRAVPRTFKEDKCSNLSVFTIVKIHFFLTCYYSIPLNPMTR